MAKAVAKAEVPANTLPAAMDDFSAFEGLSTGFENVTSRDLLIPRLTILQGLSPQVTQGKPEYDPNAKVGEIYDVGLQERFPDGVIYLPVHYTKQYLEWAPRSSGKGLQDIHDNESILEKTVVDEKGRNTLPNGNYIIETAQLYGMNVSAHFRRSFIPMASTQLKKARRLLTLATTEKVQRADGSEFTPPLFFRTYALTTVPESNAEGSWMGWKIERGQPLTEFARWKEILEDIKNFRESLVRGEARGDMSGVEHEANPSGRQQDANVPF